METKKDLRELARMVSGQVIGDDTVTIRGIAGIKEAKEGEITFVANPRYLKEIDKTQASAIIVSDQIKIAPKPLVVTKNPYLAYAKIATLFAKKPHILKGVSDNAIIGQNVTLGKDVSIYPWVFIGDNVNIGDRSVIYPFTFIGDEVSLGKDTKIYPNVSVMERCYIGNRVIIHSGAIIGSDGFGYAKDEETYYKIPQMGIVRIEDDVEIGANTTIDRAALGETWIKRGVKIDNLVQIGHNVVVGEDTIIVAQAGISGSTEVGDNVRLGGQVGIVGHLKVGNRAAVGAKSGVARSVKEEEIVSGIPAISHRDWLRVQGVLPRLPEIMRRLRYLEQRLQQQEGEGK
jgi:UDP-3-O-[3-hydroxymyristoyl] glucosamine N-acyltransferase